MTPIKYAAYLLWTLFVGLLTLYIVSHQSYWWLPVVFIIAFVLSMGSTKRDPWDDLPADDKARVASKIYRAIEDESISHAAKVVTGKKDIHDDSPLKKD